MSTIKKTRMKTKMAKENKNKDTIEDKTRNE